MGKLPLLVALLLAGTAMAFVPEASAFGYCTSLRNAQTYPDCPALLCIGTSWSYPDPYVRCQYQVPPPCCPDPYLP